MKILLISLITLITTTFGLDECQSNSSKTDVLEEKPTVEELGNLEKAYFASGCFWCVEAVFESVKGVKEAVSGYSGGLEQNPTYRQVGMGLTGHAEAVEVFYNPSEVDFKTLVTVFYDSHNPTTVNGQAPDFGPQYRSIIFYQNGKEKAIAKAYKDSLDASGAYNEPIATELLKFRKFWKAEEYHQDYEKRNPTNGYVKNVSIPRLNRFKAKHPELLKDRH